MDGSALDGEQVVTERHVVASLRSVPFANRWLFLTLNSSGLQMTLVVDKVAVSHGRIALRLLANVRSCARPLPKRQFLREDVDAHDLSWLGRVAILARDTLGTLLFFHMLHFGKELVRRTLLLHSHLCGQFGLVGPLHLLFLLLLDCLVQECSNFLVSHLICEKFYTVLGQKD